MLALHFAARLLIPSVWIFHGVYSKILAGIPRHEAIAGRILGESLAHPAIIGIGLMEAALGLWALTGRWRILCAAVQSAAIIAMNTLEIILARDLLISAPGMVILNVAFLSLVWWWALRPASRPAPSRSR
jgi:predicted anti-sigma-YlaC factor YlaD